MLVRLSKMVTAITIMTVLGIGAAWCQESKWKDRAEWDLFDSIRNEKSDAKRLELLNNWKEKYPGTFYKAWRLQYFLTTYKGLNNMAKMLETAKELVTEDPKDLQGLYWITFLTVSLANTSPDALDAGEKGASSLIANLDALKPAGASDEAWKKEKPTLEALGQRTLGWVAMQRKSNEAAEKAFMKVLEINPNDAQVAYWMGVVILGQKKAERQAESLFWFARATMVEGQGALPPLGRKQIEAYFIKLYTTYHGDASGVDDTRKYAAANPKPGPDFKIKSKFEVEAEKEEAFAKSNPQLALWLRVKKELAGPEGEKYFAEQVKGTALPRLRARVISHKPALRPKEIVVGIEKADTPEITIKLENPPTGAAKAEPGTEIEFEGAPVAFTREPFNLTVEVEKDKLHGWPAPPPPKKVIPKKAAAKKK